MSITCQQPGLTVAELSKLTKLLGMLGSDHAGERASGGLHATRLLKDARLTWDELLAPLSAPRRPSAGHCPPPDRRADEMLCDRHAAELTEWEADFLDGIAMRKVLSKKQLETLNRMANSLRNRGFV